MVKGFDELFIYNKKNRTFFFHYFYKWPNYGLIVALQCK